MISDGRHTEVDLTEDVDWRSVAVFAGPLAAAVTSALQALRCRSSRPDWNRYISWGEQDTRRRSCCSAYYAVQHLHRRSRNLRHGTGGFKEDMRMRFHEGCLMITTRSFRLKPTVMGPSRNCENSIYWGSRPMQQHRRWNRFAHAGLRHGTHSCLSHPITAEAMLGPLLSDSCLGFLEWVKTSSPRRMNLE